MTVANNQSKSEYVNETKMLIPCGISIVTTFRSQYFLINCVLYQAEHFLPSFTIEKKAQIVCNKRIQPLYNL